MPEKCENCGEVYFSVYRVPDNLWKQITGHEDGSGMICVSCFDSLAESQGVFLYWEAAIAEYPTVLSFRAVMTEIRAWAARLGLKSE